jgi:lipopolysaccharide/colanic/teichoic acid biosynthesis glycosyltransferase
MYALKRLVDITFSSIALLFLAPVMVLLMILIRLDSRGPAIFRQQRVGKDFKPFLLLKLRSMTAESTGSQITCGNDSRITRIGALLRKSKLDEIPQFWNVLRGDMSIVGPRPEVPDFVDVFRNDYKEILRVRPGITDRASIQFRSEAEILGSCVEPLKYYTDVILPAKIRLAKEYVQSASLKTDFLLIVDTIAALFHA